MATPIPDRMRALFPPAALSARLARTALYGSLLLLGALLAVSCAGGASHPAGQFADAAADVSSTNALSPDVPPTDVLTADVLPIVDATDATSEDATYPACPASAKICPEGCDPVHGLPYDPSRSCFNDQQEVVSCLPAGALGGGGPTACIKRLSDNQAYLVESAMPFADVGLWEPCSLGVAVCANASTPGACEADWDCPDIYGPCRVGFCYDGECAPNEDYPGHGCSQGEHCELGNCVPD